MPNLVLPDRTIALAAVGFDLDGTSRNTGYRAWESAAKAMADFGGTPPTYEEHILRYLHGEEFYRSRGVQGDIQDVFKRYYEYQGKEQDVPPFPDVRPFLGRLGGFGLSSFVVTGARLDPTQEWLRKFGLLGHFPEVVSIHGLGSKARALAEKVRLYERQGAVLYIGDLGCDMTDSLDASAIPIGLTRGYDCREALLTRGAALVIEGLAELDSHIVP